MLWHSEGARLPCSDMWLLKLFSMSTAYCEIKSRRQNAVQRDRHELRWPHAKQNMNCCNTYNTFTSQSKLFVSFVRWSSPTWKYCWLIWNWLKFLFVEACTMILCLWHIGASAPLAFHKRDCPAPWSSALHPAGNFGGSGTAALPTCHGDSLNCPKFQSNEYAMSNSFCSKGQLRTRPTLAAKQIALPK